MIKTCVESKSLHFHNEILSIIQQTVLPTIITLAMIHELIDIHQQNKHNNNVFFVWLVGWLFVFPNTFRGKKTVVPVLCLTALGRCFWHVSSGGGLGMHCRKRLPAGLEATFSTPGGAAGFLPSSGQTELTNDITSRHWTGIAWTSKIIFLIPFCPVSEVTENSDLGIGKLRINKIKSFYLLQVYQFNIISCIS